MSYIPTSAGLFASAVIGFTISFFIFGKVAERVIIRDTERRDVAILTLFYFALWLISLFIGETIFKLSLTPYLSQIALFSIISPYLLNLLLYFLGICVRW